MRIMAAATLLILATSIAATAQEPDGPPAEGQPAPDFKSVDQDGVNVTLSEYKGRHVVLYFYPKDDTPGCTVEAKGFTASVADFAARNAVVLGVSVDDAKSHKEFVEEYGLKVRLVADPEKTITELYGVKNWLGMASRVTFVIDRQGVIRKVFPDVTPEGHAEEVLKALDALEKPEAPHSPSEAQ